MDKEALKSIYPHYSENQDLKLNSKTDFLEFLDDTVSEFHDPYSNLNLFLTKKIKEEIKTHTPRKKWSTLLQERLIAKITPEFQKQFPYYRLGIATLKKIWEKASYFSQILENQQGALTKEGNLNIEFLIRENLRPFLTNQNKWVAHPYLIAQQLALKITECLASYEGSRPLLESIVQMVWFAQKHLISPKKFDPSAEVIDDWDRLIIRFMFEINEKKGALSPLELQNNLRETVHSFQSVACLDPADHLVTYVSLSLSKKLYPYLLFQPSLTEELFSFLSLNNGNEMTATQLVAQAKADYLKKNRSHSLKEDEIDIVLWKRVQEKKRISSLPPHLYERIEEEIGNALIAQPYHSFTSLVNEVVQLFVKTKKFSTKPHSIENKIKLWSLQGDLAYRLVKIEPNHLLNLMINLSSDTKSNLYQSEQTYLKMYPFIASFSTQLKVRINIFRKYIWYAVLSKPEEPTINRFFQWHFQRLNHQKVESVLTQIEKICKEQFPLLPFDHGYVEKLLMEQQKQAK